MDAADLDGLRFCSFPLDAAAVSGRPQNPSCPQMHHSCGLDHSEFETFLVPLSHFLSLRDMKLTSSVLAHAIVCLHKAGLPEG